MILKHCRFKLFLVFSGQAPACSGHSRSTCAFFDRLVLTSHEREPDETMPNRDCGHQLALSHNKLAVVATCQHTNELDFVERIFLVEQFACFCWMKLTRCYIHVDAHLRSEKAKRLMLGKEQLHALGFPCSTRGATAARTDSWQNQCPESSM